MVTTIPVVKHIVSLHERFRSSGSRRYLPTISQKTTSVGSIDLTLGPSQTVSSGSRHSFLVPVKLSGFGFSLTVTVQLTVVSSCTYPSFEFKFTIQFGVPYAVSSLMFGPSLTKAYEFTKTYTNFMKKLVSHKIYKLISMLDKNNKILNNDKTISVSHQMLKLFDHLLKQMVLCNVTKMQEKVPGFQ